MEAMDIENQSILQAKSENKKRIVPTFKQWRYQNNY
jgi:hypothetical protein